MDKYLNPLCKYHNQCNIYTKEDKYHNKTTKQLKIAKNQKTNN